KNWAHNAAAVARLRVRKVRVTTYRTASEVVTVKVPHRVRVEVPHQVTVSGPPTARRPKGAGPQRLSERLNATQHRFASHRTTHTRPEEKTMFDMARFEQQLNTDAALRAEFLRDPVAVFRRMGLLLSLSQQEDLRRAVAQGHPRRPVVPGQTGGGPSIGT